MRRLLIGALVGAFVGALALVGFVGTAKAADTPGCVTRAEYRSVHAGDRMSRVHRIFDIRGRRMSIATSGGFASQIRSYKTCSQFSSVAIAYDKEPGGVWRLAAKSAVWVG
jgi:hypothetical protein